MDDFNFIQKQCGLYGGLPKNEYPKIDIFEPKTCGLYGGPPPKIEYPRIERIETKTCGIYGGLPKNNLPDYTSVWQSKMNMQTFHEFKPLQNQINMATGRTYQNEMMGQRPMMQNEIKLF